MPPCAALFVQTKAMKILVVITSVALVLSACGGGGDDSPPNSSPVVETGAPPNVTPVITPAELPPEPAPDRVVEEPARDESNVVAWVSGQDAYIQRQDKAGQPVGEAIKLPIPQDPAIEFDFPHPPTPPAVVVQANREVAVMYVRVRPANQLDPSLPDDGQQHAGVYLQRFDADGAQVQGEREVISTLRFVPGARLHYESLRTLGLSDGSFVLSWGLAYRGGLGATQVDYFMQRFDDAGFPSSEIIVPVKNYWFANRHLNSTFEWDADDRGGFSISGTAYPKEFDGDSELGGFGPPVERHVYTYYPGATPPDAATLEKRKACVEAARGLEGAQRKASIDSCMAR